MLYMGLRRGRSSNRGRSWGGLKKFRTAKIRKIRRKSMDSGGILNLRFVFGQLLNYAKPMHCAAEWTYITLDDKVVAVFRVDFHCTFVGFAVTWIVDAAT